jgi:hypothetical protein
MIQCRRLENTFDRRKLIEDVLYLVLFRHELNSFEEFKVTNTLAFL